MKRSQTEHGSICQHIPSAARHLLPNPGLGVNGFRGRVLGGEVFNTSDSVATKVRQRWDLDDRETPGLPAAGPSSPTSAAAPAKERAHSG